MRKSIIIGIVVIVMGGAISFLFASMKEAPERKTNTEQLQLVPALRVQNENIQSKIEVIGTLTAKSKVDIYAEVSGVLERSEKEFLVGVSYEEGEILLNINSDETYMSLMSKRSSLLNLITQIMPELKFDYTDSYDQWLAYLDQFDLNTQTNALPEPKSNQEKYFIAGKNIYQTYYDIISLETRLDKYTIRAPFSGIICESNIKPGTLVMNGQKLGAYLDPTVFDLEAEVGVNEIAFINVGDKVLLSSENMEGQWIAYVSRISETVDSNTQTLKVYITVKDKALKEGQFLKGSILTSTNNYAVEIPRKLIFDNNQIFTIKNGLIERTTIDIVQINKDAAIVKGLDDGTIISVKTKGIHKGLKVEADIQS